MVYYAACSHPHGILAQCYHNCAKYAVDQARRTSLTRMLCSSFREARRG